MGIPKAKEVGWLKATYAAKIMESNSTEWNFFDSEMHVDAPGDVYR
jgi:hypothetical protein